MSKPKTYRYLALLPPNKCAWVLARLLFGAFGLIADCVGVVMALAALVGSVVPAATSLVPLAADALMLCGAAATLAAVADAFTACGYVPEGMRLIDGHVAEEIGIAHALRRDLVWSYSLASALAGAESMSCLALGLKGGGPELFVSAALALVLSLLIWARSCADRAAADKKGTADD